MKIRKVSCNNRRKVFELSVSGRTIFFPYARCSPRPGPDNRIVEAAVDRELGREGFTYRLESGAEGTVHVEQVLEYNRDPNYMKDLFVYRLTLEAIRRVDSSPLSKREIIRRLGTSATQFYRLLDPANYGKSPGQLLSLLCILDCEVDLVIRNVRGPTTAGHSRVRGISAIA